MTMYTDLVKDRKASMIYEQLNYLPTYLPSAVRRLTHRLN